MNLISGEQPFRALLYNPLRQVILEQDIISAHRLILLLWLASMAIGCATRMPAPPPQTAAAPDPQTLRLLYDHYHDWRGVRYREGGLSKNGVDCSGYVYLAFRERFAHRLPRSTELQAGAGRQIDPRRVRAGDLVFFKTGWKQRHVGIYLENGAFMHASTSRGVMISKLHNPYWTDAFWMARRVDLEAR